MQRLSQNSLLERLATKVLAHPRRVLAIWAAVALISAAVAAGLFGQLANRGFVAEGSDSDRALTALERYLPSHHGSELFAMVTARRSDSTRSDDALRRRAVATADRLSNVLDATDHVSSVDKVVTRAVHDSDDETLDQIVTVFAVSLDLSPADAESEVPGLRSVARESAGDGASVDLLGGIPVSRRFTEIARTDLANAERIALPITFLVLLIAFLSVTAAAIPVVLAVVTLVVTLALLFLVGLQVGLSVFVTNTASVLALGLSIDFSLFMVTRYREELESTGSYEAAIVRTMGTTGRAVTLSGLTIAAVLLSLFAVDIGLFSSMALGGTVAAMVAVLAATTLLPAAICVLGPRLDRFALAPARQAARRGTLWRRLADSIAARPVTMLLASLLILGALAIPALSLRIDFHTVGGLPADDPLNDALHDAERTFGKGVGVPIDVVTRGDAAKIDEVVRADPNVRAVVQTQRGNYGWSSMQALMRGPPDDPRAAATVHRLRAELARERGPSHVGGLTAAAVDLTDRVNARTPAVVGIAVLFAFVALTWGLQSLLIPLKAVLSTLLTVAATLGLLLIAFPADASDPSLEFFVPLFLFAVVFGLSLDYEVFLLSRIREASLAGLSPTESVKLGLIRSGRSITLAGISLAVVFAAFATSSLDAFRQLGAGVAIAVVLDVTLVRCILIPAAAIVLGRWNWWLPGKLVSGVRS